METPSSPPDSPSEGSTRDRLRELRERAHSSLANQRSRLHDLEQQLAQRMESVAAELATHLADETSADSQQAVEEAQSELDRQREEWEAELARTDAELSQRMDDLAVKLTDLAERELEFERRREEFADQADSYREQQQSLESEWASLEAARRELADAQQQFEATQAQAVQTDDQQRQQLEQELADARTNLEALQTELAQRDQALGSTGGELDGLRVELETARGELEGVRGELATALTESGGLREQLETQQAQFETERQGWQQAQAGDADAATQRISELEAQLAEDAAVHQQQQQTLRAELADTEIKLANLQSTIDSHGSSQAEAEAAWREEREALLAEKEQLAGTLEKVTQKLAGAEAGREPQEEVQRKFDLALRDLRTLRQRTAELEQQLAQRPEQDPDNSAELMALRGERDALASEVEELRNRPMSAESDDAAMADLQRRFEMAVEDVRELRAEKEELEERLARKADASEGVVAGGEEKWEELKRKLLLSLEDESEEPTEGRREERASIEHTIRITDDVVASKDREIHELREQMESLGEQHAAGAVHSLQETIDADEVVMQHRQRIADIETELTEKLRQAELELSLERAKIAREQTELAEWRIELEAIRDAIPQRGEGGNSGGAGKTRWFSKLGLGGDEG